MRATINLTVSGSDHKQLWEEAQRLYRNYLNDETAVLPAATHLEVSPLIETADGGTINWTAEVVVSVNNSTI